MPISLALLRERATIDDWSGLPMDVAKCITPEPNTGCWLWLGGVAGSKAPYPAMRRAGRHYVHRFVYEFLVGSIPSGLTIDHLCRQTTCVNPAHLEPVTPTENNRRGQSATMRASLANTCIKGHLLTTQTHGSRVCLTCKRERRHRYYWRDPKAAAAKALVTNRRYRARRRAECGEL